MGKRIVVGIVAVTVVALTIVSAQAGNVRDVDVDTLELNGIMYRLLDVDAPEKQQVCWRLQGKYWCGSEATRKLQVHAALDAYDYLGGDALKSVEGASSLDFGTNFAKDTALQIVVAKKSRRTRHRRRSRGRGHTFGTRARYRRVCDTLLYHRGKECLRRLRKRRILHPSRRFLPTKRQSLLRGEFGQHLPLVFHLGFGASSS